MRAHGGWTRGPAAPAAVPSLCTLAAPSLLFLIGCSPNWRRQAAGCPRLGTPGLSWQGTRGSPSWPEGNAPGLRLARFGRFPWTLANGTPAFPRTDLHRCRAAGRHAYPWTLRRGHAGRKRESGMGEEPERGKALPYCSGLSSSHNVADPTPGLPAESTRTVLLSRLPYSLV